MKWTSAEEQLLKQLKEKYGKNQWQKIAKDLNASNLNTIKKNGRQCRDKFINCNKFSEENKEDLVWSQDERTLMYELYMRYGSSWSNFEPHFPNKSLNCIKNKFYNAIRKMACGLGNFQKQNFEDFRNPITPQNILSILQLGHYLRAWIAQHNHKQSQKSQIFSAGRQILMKTIVEQSQEDENFKNYIVKQFKSLNCKLKCLGIYKTGVKKEWKLTQRRLKFILKNDTIIESQQEYMELLAEQKKALGKQIQQQPLSFEKEELESLNLQQQQNFIKIQSINKEIYQQNQYKLMGISEKIIEQTFIDYI